MKTTLEIPDALFREAKSRAALENLKLKDLVTEGLQMRLAKAGRTNRRTKFPLIKSKGKRKLQIPNDASFRADLVDDLAHL